MGFFEFLDNVVNVIGDIADQKTVSRNISDFNGSQSMYDDMMNQFLYVDNNIDAREIALIKEYAQKNNISGDVDAMAKSILSNTDSVLEDYAKSISFLTLNLTEEEKRDFIYDAVNLANIDNEFAENEFITIEALARNWNLQF